jgi:hypothetical protein
MAATNAPQPRDFSDSLEGGCARVDSLAGDREVVVG